MATTDDLLKQSISEGLLAKRISGATGSYAKDNPTEYKNVKAYLDGGTRPTGSLTHMGNHLVLEEDARRGLAPPADVTPPSVPANLRLVSSGQTDVSLAWDVSADDVGVAGYGVHNGGSLTPVTAPSATLTGLTCGTSYSIGVDAFDVAGNHSALATLDVQTASCSPPPPNVLPDGSSLAAAYTAAAAGSVIQLSKDFTYTGFSFTGTKSPAVVFDLGGASLGALVVHAHGIEFRNGSATYVSWSAEDNPPSDVTFRNFKTVGIFWNGGTNISWIGGELGPQASDQLNWLYSAWPTLLTKVLLDGVVIHDNHCVSGGCHYEAVRIDRGVDGVIIRNCTFLRNAVFHVFITSGSSVYPKNITIDHNTFDAPLGGGTLVALNDPVLTTVDPALLHIHVTNNVAPVGTGYRGPFEVYSGNTFV